MEPEFVTRYRRQGESYLAEKRIGEIEFSGATYQVQVMGRDPAKELWAFLQFDAKSHLKDFFCSCEMDQEGRQCEHLAAAYLTLYNGKAKPLHVRFENSPWHQLCFLFGQKLGWQSSLLGKSSENAYSAAGFSVTPLSSKAEKLLKHWTEERVVETEETSLKFSQVPEEEIELWRTGRSSNIRLQYELSFWSDLAKWWMLLQERGSACSFRFEEIPGRLPQKLTLSFEGIVQASFLLSEQELISLIPSLEEIKSNLPIVDTAHQSIQSITYDRSQGAFHIIGDFSHNHAKQGIPCGDWSYIPHKGFYGHVKFPLLERNLIPFKEMDLLLNKHAAHIQDLIVGETIYLQPQSFRISLRFDEKWNLHLDRCFSGPGDLDLPATRSFGRWWYIDGCGFVPIERGWQEPSEVVINKEQVSAFVSKHRAWLNTHPGFETRLSTLETLITYDLSPEGTLSFRRLLLAEDGSHLAMDFGLWIYIKDQGFYSRASLSDSPITTGTVRVSKKELPQFIRKYREELSLIQNFFIRGAPILNSSLVVDFNQHGEIEITPRFHLSPDFEGRSVRFFDGFAYIQGAGFYEIPADQRLPEPYSESTIIDIDDIDRFLKEDLERIRPKVSKMTSALSAPYRTTLVVNDVLRNDLTARGWMTLSMSYQTEIGEVNVIDVWKEVKRKKKYFFSPAGFLDLTNPRFYWLNQISEKQIKREGEALSLSVLELFRLHALEDISLDQLESKKQKQLHKLLEELGVDEDPNLTGLLSNLRPYQTIGVQWLWTLYNYHLSGLLCDDMGLGKTHQAMALIAAAYNKCRTENPGSSPLFLIVCPTSVIYHWQEKLSRFLPQMRIRTFYGLDRTLDPGNTPYDIVLTSYGILKRTQEDLSNLFFEVAVFDEIQIAKNHQTRVHGAISKLEAHMRLGMTGTPIENYIKELKALFDAVLPGYMPGHHFYQEFFVTPIEKMGDNSRKKLLNRYIKPFILRRKKEMVLDDLPDKTEDNAICELVGNQKELYTDVLLRARDRLLSELENDGNSVPYMHIFALLSSLKQICNHPASYEKDTANYANYESGKWNLFTELLDEALASGQKVVVFSQFLGMLDIMSNYLRSIDVGYASIRGATRDRGAQLQRFQEDPSCMVFLGSLQAVGIGVDLTAASVVIHYDRWWNAARENQATDRVHRIGQHRGVQVFKMTTKDTIEDRIDQMILKKGSLMEEIIGVDDHNVLKTLSRDQLIEMLQLPT